MPKSAPKKISMTAFKRLVPVNVTIDAFDQTFEIEMQVGLAKRTFGFAQSMSRDYHKMSGEIDCSVIEGLDAAAAPIRWLTHLVDSWNLDMPLTYEAVSDLPEAVLGPILEAVMKAGIPQPDANGEDPNA